MSCAGGHERLQLNQTQEEKGEWRGGSGGW